MGPPCTSPSSQNDLWSEDEDEDEAPPPPTSGSKRAAPAAAASSEAAAPRKRPKRPDAKLHQQLLTSLADSSEGIWARGHPREHAACACARKRERERSHRARHGRARSVPTRALPPCVRQTRCAHVSRSWRASTRIWPRRRCTSSRASMRRRAPARARTRTATRPTGAGWMGCRGRAVRGTAEAATRTEDVARQRDRPDAN
eukprot:2190267-Prymnesium_polylepis.1